MSEVVDLTLDSDDEAQAKKRIMDFAAVKNACKRPRQDVVESAGLSAPARPTPEVMHLGAHSLLAQLHMERQQRMQKARGLVNSSDEASPANAAAPERAPASPRAAAAATSSARPPGAGVAPPRSAAARAADAGGGAAPGEVSLLTYNVWFREDVALEARMAGIGDIITKAGYPTFICFQEVTHNILALWRGAPWWRRYTGSPAPPSMPYFTLLLVRRDAPGVVPGAFEGIDFPGSVMGRGLLASTATVGGRQLCIATSHLESPCPPGNFYTSERAAQMRQALSELESKAARIGNVVFAGDMNWTDSRDGSVQLPSGWQDAWATLHPEAPGFTYDTKANPMLFSKWPGSRLDRVLVRLQDWRLSSVCMVGTQPLPGVTYWQAFRNGGKKSLPVLPSDHFGLLLQLHPTK